MPAHAKKRIRRVVLGLGFLLAILIVMFVIWASPFQQARAVRSIRRGHGSPSISFDAGRMPNQLRHWLWPYLSEIYAVNCNQRRARNRSRSYGPPVPPFDDRWLQRLLPDLKKLPDLERLTLSHTAITNEGLQGLSSLEHVRAVDLSQTAITDEAIPALVAMPALEQVDLSATQVTTEGRVLLKRQRPALLIQEFDFSETVPPRLP